MDQLVMTGLFPAGSEERRGEGRKGEERIGKEWKGVWLAVQGYSRFTTFCLHHTRNMIDP